MGRLNLKKFRIELNLKSKQMAEKTGISRSHYSNIENGKKDPTYEYMGKFEKVFEVEESKMWGLFKKA